jgi:hypothetical protein
MAIFEDKKSGKKSFSMNPQMGRAMHGGGGMKKKEDGAGKRESAHFATQLNEPGEHPKLANYDGHEHNGHLLAHHVELHHGGHPQGEPPMHEGHTHHTITHPHSMHEGGGGGSEHEHSGEPEIHNHESMEEAHEHEDGAMHEACPECEAADHGELAYGDTDDSEPTEEQNESA